MSFSLVTRQILLLCLFQHHPAFLPASQGRRSHWGGRGFGVGSSVLIEPVMPVGVGRIWRCPNYDNWQRFEFFLSLKACPLVFLPRKLPSKTGGTGMVYLMEEGDHKCKESSRTALWPAGFCLFSLSAQLLYSPIGHFSYGH